MMLAAALASLAIVTQDQTALRAAPRDSAPQQVVLSAGDSLEVRGEKMDFLQVYDHRRERAGYIRAAQVRQYAMEPADAPALASVMNFVRDTPGAEALGIGYTAAFLKAAPAQAIGPDAFETLGVLSERLARRASAVQRSKTADAVLAAQLDTAASYGITMQSFERDGRVQMCYTGDAFRRVLAHPASTPLQRARAALALTRHDCIPPETPPTARYALDVWRAEVLDRVERDKLPDYLKNRIQMRRAGVWASLAFQRTRKGEPVQNAARTALDALTSVNKHELAEDDASAYTDAAVRTSASRWAAEPAPAAPKGFGIVTAPGQPGETCVKLVDAQHDAQHPLFAQCTYGIVWTASARANPRHTALTLAVQPLDTWRELWVFRQTATGWSVDVLPPAMNNPDIGYLEFAGWTPDGTTLLAAREARVDGRYKRSFELIRLETLETEKHADKPEAITAFVRWQEAGWKRGTLSVR